MISRKRIYERFRAYRKVFKQNWALFKASKIGIVGIVIVLFFVGMAVITPFLNLRDPINWRAPEEDFIDVTSYWASGINVSEPYYYAGDPINHSVTFRVKQLEGQELRADRVYFTSGNKLFSVRPAIGDSYWIDESPRRHYAFAHPTGAPFSTDVVVANFGGQYDPDQVDYILAVGTYDGYIYIIEDYAGKEEYTAKEPIPASDMVFTDKLDSTVTSAALFSDTNLGRTPRERFYFGTEGGCVYAYSAVKLDNEDWTYDGFAESWAPLQRGEEKIAPSPRKNFAMAYDSKHDRIVLFGGYDGLLNDETWIYDPGNESWRRVEADPHPSARQGHAMTYDPGMGVVLLFGGNTKISGFSPEYSNETWAFNVDTETWTNWDNLVNDRPDARAEHSMAFDSWNGVTVLFGGTVGGNETWTFDASQKRWSNNFPSLSPSERTGHAMAYDSMSKVIVLFGGSNGGNETWIYNVTNNTWYNALPSSPPSERTGHAMAYDSATDEVILFGGTSGGDETWAYDVTGNVWREVFTDTPSSREGHAMVYDSARMIIHLFGGDDDKFSRLWYRRLTEDHPIIMAGFPLNSPTDPNYSPALNRDGSLIFVNDGELHPLYTDNGMDAWEVGTVSIGANWTNPPVVARPYQIGGVYLEVVYATSNDGWIYAWYTSNGSALAHWEELGYYNNKTHLAGGIPLKISALEYDDGSLTIPEFYEEYIYVASSSGHVYKIRRDSLPGIPAGSNVWVYSDRLLVSKGFKFTGGVRLERKIGLLFVSGYEDSGTPNDPSDDKGTIFSIGEDGTLRWRLTFDGRIPGTPSVWRDEIGIHTTSSVWFATEKGYVHSYSSTGMNKAPLPPGCYPSGNCYILGTDSQARDIFSQMMWGSQIALTVGLLAAAGSIGIGTIIGLVSGYSGGKIDSVLMRFTDVILVLPGLPFIIILAAVLGPSYWNIIFVLTIIGWPGTARVIRSEVLSLKERPFIDSARVTGASNFRIMFKHLAPNVMPLAFLYMTLAVSGAILSEAALSFLGVGDVNTPSWGQMLQAIQTQNVLAAWWWLLPPGLAITFISLAFYLIGRAFEQIVNPRLRKR
ncbi:MAG: kelch repeat-containing protein [Thermoplasmata archaeon]